MNQPFPKLRPVPPDEDWIAPWLTWSGRVSTVGWIVYGVFALAFDDIALIPPAWQSLLVILGSALIVTGAEMNTFPMVVAVARKWGAHKGQPLDVVAFTVSLIGSVVAGLIAFSIRQTRLGDSVWRVLALDWGPLVVGIAIAADFYAAAVELGLLRSDYDRDIEQWLAEQGEWNESHGYVPPVVTDPEWKRARIADFRRVVAGLNGSAAGLNAEQLESEFAAVELRMPPESTYRRWLRTARRVEVN